MVPLKIPTIRPAYPASHLGNPPRALQLLFQLAYNLRWSWRRETQALFEKVNPSAWAKNVSPVKLLLQVKDWSIFEEGSELADQIAREHDLLSEYLATPDGSPLAALNKQIGERPVAYFCAEYALHTSMNQYAGGLGILAGDHCKEASDCHLPFVAVGLFYRRGFFHQSLDWSGRQEVVSPSYLPEELPLLRVLDSQGGDPLTIRLELPGRDVQVGVWLMEVGRMPLVLLDTDFPENRPEDRKITSQVYTNQREMRFYQEVVLGIGGVRALRAIGIHPSSFHLNEGHSAMLILERLREFVAGGQPLDKAIESVRKASVLTIHTPVPEGNERFSAELVREVLGPIVSASALSLDSILENGLGADEDPGVFDMTAYALRHASAANGVSLLHGQTADATWKTVLGKTVTGITNGVHMPTWLGPEMRDLFEEAGAKFDPWTELSVLPEQRPIWEPALQLDGARLWDAHLKQKRKLIVWAQQRLFEEAARHGQGPTYLSQFSHALDPDSFLIGFARRFATYKRAALLFSDLERFLNLMEGSNLKIQILFSGKSHPTDRGGQELIQKVFELSQSPSLFGKVFLLEDYDMETGGNLVQGVDLWLNNPRRPLEASGTSGMKAAANGVPNLSILDGWWDEGFDPKQLNGWAIGDRTTPKDLRRQDRKDSKALYSALEKHVIPCFKDRDEFGIPQKWVQVMKNSIASSLYSFSTERMLRDYAAEMYVPNGG
jgi:starch phosphorylase